MMLLLALVVRWAREPSSARWDGRCRLMLGRASPKDPESAGAKGDSMKLRSGKGSLGPPSWEASWDCDAPLPRACMQQAL